MNWKQNWEYKFEKIGILADCQKETERVTSESYHALIKREWINRLKIFNYSHAYKLVFEYIETFYNTVRSHSHCGYLSPAEYEEEYLQKLKKLYVRLQVKDRKLVAFNLYFFLT